MKYTNLNPFDHGTTIVSYASIPENESSRLIAIIEEGWGINDISKISRVSEGSEKRGNAFRVESETRYLLKRSRIEDAPAQSVINNCMMYCGERGILVPRPVPTSSGTVYSLGENIFCLYNFIEGEHFDGSQRELRNIAVEIAKLHWALKGNPYEDEIKRIRGRSVKHDSVLLEEAIKKARESGGRTEFDSYVLSILDEIGEHVRAITATNLEKLPSQTIHNDLQPHNALFDGDTQEVRATVDFDSLCYAQRVRDVGFAMHRFARTYGERTERKNGIGEDMKERARIFIDTYSDSNTLTDEEITALPLIIQENALQRIIGTLIDHYLKHDTSWDFDLRKQVITLREAALFSF